MCGCEKKGLRREAGGQKEEVRLRESVDHAGVTTAFRPDGRPVNSTDRVAVDAARTVSGVLLVWLRHPASLWRGWNWKSAVLSTVLRGGIFFAANVSAGRDAATAALLTDAVLRLTTAGFYGAATQAFRRVEPAWRAAAATAVLMPALAHGVELTVHALRHTANLKTSILASIAFTVLSTQFHLFVMRRGALIVGHGSRSLGADLMRLPWLTALFVAQPLAALVRLGRHPRG
jgi:hypothetical protein